MGQAKHESEDRCDVSRVASARSGGVDVRAHGRDIAYQQQRRSATRWSETEHTRCLEDWPWGRKDERHTTPELDFGVGVIPTIQGDGLIPMPHGSDWSSIREAGMNADKQRTSLGDAARRDR